MKRICLFIDTIGAILLYFCKHIGKTPVFLIARAVLKINCSDYFTEFHVHTFSSSDSGGTEAQIGD